MNIKISVAAAGPGIEDVIPSTLAEAKYLLIFEAEKLELIKVFPAETDKHDVFYAEKTVDENCEAILCGEIMEEAFEILAGSCVTRYLASGESAGNAVDLMNKYQLPLIRDYHGGPGCSGEDSHGECHCDDQDSEDL
ncbi:MAG TPA: hypothetical protein GXZ27_00010 [Thermoanaerobacterales bacterium]|jgi:predicted Fe-Mo cluster-binding NifX family protein|nr:hypothetical protein [Thermoanaerobacterales bacterium]